MKRIFAWMMAAMIALAAIPALGAEGDGKLVVTVTPETVEVGDQFLVRFTVEGIGKYLTYQIDGTFPTELAELIAPVYAGDSMSIMSNNFDNEAGTFCIAGADFSAKGVEDSTLFSLLFRAKAPGEFIINMGEELGQYKLVFVGRADRAEGESLDYPIEYAPFRMTIADDSDEEDVVLIADKEQKTPYDDMFTYEWAETAVSALAQLGVLEDVADTSFRPGDNVTRGDFMLMLMRACKLKSTKEPGTFPDVPADLYAAEAIGLAKNLGIANGDMDGNFKPNDSITREDIACLVFRTMSYMKKVNPTIEAENYLKECPDRDAISDYAKDSMAAMLRAKLLRGDENEMMNPTQNMTRAEAAVLLERIMTFNLLVS